MDASGPAADAADTSVPARTPVALRVHQRAALQRRLARLEGTARHLVERRLARLDDEDLARTPQETTTSTAPRAAGALAALVDALEAARTARPQPAPDAAPGVQRTATPRGDTGTVEDLRRIWSEVRTRSQVRQSLEQVPTHAGPLNSGTLVHRALRLMRDASPGYLRHFMAYVDALSGLEALRGPAVPVAAAPVVRRAPRGAAKPEPRPKARPKPRAKPRRSKRLIAKPRTTED